jgi:3D (Asp-Asp-Asp) domain-containing protein
MLMAPLANGHGLAVKGPFPMYRPLSIALAAILLAGCAGPTSNRTAAGKRLTIRTTAYTAFEPGGAYSACGERLHFGGDTYSAAADWSWMPLGTRFKMLENGRTYVIEDYGSALVGRNTVDLFMPSGKEMRNWGARNVEVQILEWGSPVMSLKLLEPRQKFAPVREMVAKLHSRAPSPELLTLAPARDKPMAGITPVAHERKHPHSMARHHAPPGNREVSKSKKKRKH